VTPRFRILSFADQRTPEQRERGRALAQEQADQLVEAEWRRRVRANVARRRKVHA
jgi:23S rRNA G2069 N7-methylase RlmK/C1962 C5-methylase RlmI